MFIGSLSGWITSPGGALYASTKHAIRSLSESLNAEIFPLGLRSICFDFGTFKTDVLKAGNRVIYEPRIEDYMAIGTYTEELMIAYDGNQPGDPAKGVQIMIDVVKGEGVARGKTPPAVVTLGKDIYLTTEHYCRETVQRIEEWKDVSCSTDF